MKKQIIVRALPQFLLCCMRFLCFHADFVGFLLSPKAKKCILGYGVSANFINNYLQKQYICLNFAEVKLIIFGDGNRKQDCSFL